MILPRKIQLLRSYLEITTWALFSVTLACIVMGLSLQFPSSGLDPSWKFAVNEAVVRGMSFGKDFIFTFGPYSSLYTGIYHPTIDTLILSAGLLLTLGLTFSLFILYGRQNYLLLFVTCVFLAAYKQTDALLFFFPLSLSLVVHKLFSENSTQPEKNRGTYYTIVTISLFSILGLLPLIKVSTALICATTMLVSGTYAILIRRYILGAGIFITPCLMMLFLWIIGGQKPDDLVTFFQNSAPIVGGYTEAMSTYGSNYEIALFTLTCFWGVIILFRSEHQQSIRIYIALNFALYLFLCFKAGFTRHDGHAMIAGSAIVMAGFALTTIYRKPGVLLWLLGCFATWFSIESHYSPVTISDTVQRISNRYISSLTGLYSRAFDLQGVKNEYNKSIIKITNEVQLPHLPGTSDIYSYQQSYLLASGNTWHPRPVIQSYSAYTAKLAKINSDFLATQGADNIFFNVETIDGRLPSLDDGASWPILLTNYDIVGSDLNFLQFKRKSHNTAQLIASEKQASIEGHIGETIEIPNEQNNTFMQIELKPNLLGRIRGVLFKQSMLRIIITTRDRQEVSYRFIPSMANSIFLISPLVRTNSDFLNFASRESTSPLPNEVVSFRLEGSNSELSGWNKDFKVNLTSYEFPPTGRGLVKYNTALDDITSNLPKKQALCNGVIDSVNQQVPPPMNISAGELSVEGWLVPAKDAKANPAETYIYLHDETDRYRFYSTQKTPRLDVKAYLGTPDIADPGYKSIFLTNELSGKYEIGLARKVGGKIELCEQPKIIVIIDDLR